MLFTSQFNKLLWSLKRKLNISHKRAYHLARNAMRFGYDNRLQADSSVFGTWSNDAARCAGHYCQSLSTAYDAAGDKGRSIAFYRAASIIQNMNTSTLQEACSYWYASERLVCIMRSPESDVFEYNPP